MAVAYTLQARKSCFPGRVTRDELSRRETAENELVGPRRTVRAHVAGGMSLERRDSSLVDRNGPSYREDRVSIA